MLGFEFHPEASAEYGEAIDYYKQIKSLLAQAFLEEIEHGIGMIRKHPDRWRVVEHETLRNLTSEMCDSFIYLFFNED